MCRKAMDLVTGITYTAEQLSQTVAVRPEQLVCVDCKHGADGSLVVFKASSAITPHFVTWFSASRLAKPSVSIELEEAT